MLCSAFHGQELLASTFPREFGEVGGSGSLYLTRPTLNSYIATREELEWRANDILTWVQQGKLKVRIGQEFPLAEAGQAQTDLASRKTSGKLILIP